MDLSKCMILVTKDGLLLGHANTYDKKVHIQRVYWLNKNPITVTFVEEKRIKSFESVLNTFTERATINHHKRLLTYNLTRRKK